MCGQWQHCLVPRSGIVWTTTTSTDSIWCSGSLLTTRCTKSVCRVAEICLAAVRFVDISHIAKSTWSDGSDAFLLIIGNSIFSFQRRKRKMTMNMEPSRKIVSSFLLESKGSWGSGIMRMSAVVRTLKGSAPGLWFDALLIARIRKPSSIPSLIC